MHKWGYGNEKVCASEYIEMKMCMLQWDYVKENLFTRGFTNYHLGS